jgi:hypothetical protein
LQSQTFSSASWSKTNVTETSDTTAAPDGTTTADTLLFAGGGLLSGIFQTPVSYLSGFSYTQSVFAKYIDQQWIQITFGSAAFGSSQYANFDIQNGAVGGVAGGTASIVSVGNNWYRCIFTATATSTASSTGGQVTGIDGTGAIRNATLTASSTSVYLWGAQLNIANMEGGVTSSLTTYYPTTTAAYYAPRFDYNPSTLQPRGLLIEEARTNSFLQSENFSTTWSANSVSVSTDSAVAPSGTVTADTLNDGAVAAASHSLVQTPTIAASTTYAVSVFAKNIDRRYFGIAISTTSSNNYGTVEFDLNGVGAVNRTAVLGTGFAIVSSSITNVGNGWFRCVAVITTGSAAVTDGRATIYLSDGAGAFDSRGRATYSGANASIYAWGAQLEAGAFATSYIPTTTTALTRNADVASMTGTNFSSWYNATEGTVYAESSLFGSSVNRDVISISDNTSSNAISLRWASGSQAQFSVAVGGAGQVNIAPAGYSTLNQVYKRAVAYKLDDFAQAIDKTLVGTDTSGTVPTVDRMYLGANTSGSTTLCGYISRVAFYPQRLPNTTLQALTA